MLKERVSQYIEVETKDQTIQLYQEEKEFAEKNELLQTEVTVKELDPKSRFDDAYIERGDKVTEEVLAQETSAFLKQPLEYFKKHKNEFLYVESKWFELIKVDAVSFEMDDVFGTYDVMLGLRLPKKQGAVIKNELRRGLQAEGMPFDLLFSNGDGLWELNFALNHIPGFNEELTIVEAYCLIYRFIFMLVDTVETTEK